jgi:hypothetical protein
MSLRRPSRNLIAAAILATLTCLSAVAQTSPEAFLGHKVGADRKLADYWQIKAYFEKLDAESPKLQLLTIGESTLKKPMIMAVITSEANMGRLARFKEIAKRLRDPRTLSPEDAARLAGEGKAVLLITCSLHASEVAASQMSMEFAYDLVTGKTPFDGDKALDNVIVLLVPTSNPDGHQMECEWYAKNLDEVRGRQHALDLPSLRGPRQQPRLVHVQPLRDAGHHQGPVPRLAPPDPHR